MRIDLCKSAPLSRTRQAVSYNDKIYMFGGLRLKEGNPPGEVLNSLVSVRVSLCERDPFFCFLFQTIMIEAHTLTSDACTDVTTHAHMTHSQLKHACTAAPAAGHVRPSDKDALSAGRHARQKVMAKRGRAIEKHEGILALL